MPPLAAKSGSIRARIKGKFVLMVTSCVTLGAEVVIFTDGAFIKFTADILLTYIAIQIPIKGKFVWMVTRDPSCVTLGAEVVIFTDGACIKFTADILSTFIAIQIPIR